MGCFSFTLGVNVNSYQKSILASRIWFCSEFATKPCRQNHNTTRTCGIDHTENIVGMVHYSTFFTSHDSYSPVKSHYKTASIRLSCEQVNLRITINQIFCSYQNSVGFCTRTSVIYCGLSWLLALLQIWGRIRFCLQVQIFD